MNQINIGTKIDLADLLQSRLLIQANSGGGKSVLARVIIEESFGIVPFIIMDIEGEYYTLKEKFGDILVIGGQHADIPLSLKSVKLLPREIIGNRLSVVIDTSDLQMSDRILYAKQFLETMMDLPKDYWINYLVFLEEAHKLCGEQDKQASAAAVKDLMSRGRKRGYAGVLITQRISKLHKDAAAECNNKFIGRTFLDIDLDRAAKELALSSAADKLKIRDLSPGCFYAFGTSIEPHHVHEVKIKLPQTKIPKAGVDLNIKPKAPTEKIKALLVKLNDLPAEGNKTAKSGNNSQVSAINSPELQKKYDELKFHYDDMHSHYKEAVRERDHYFNLLVEMDVKLREIGKIMSGHIGPLEPMKKTVQTNYVVSQPTVQKVFSKTEPPQRSVQPSAELKSGSGAMRMLKAAAMFYPNSTTVQRIAALAGMSHTSGTFGVYFRTLKRDGFITVDGKIVTATKEGVDKAGDFPALPTDPASIIQMWCNNVGAESGMAKMLRHLFDQHPNWLTAQELGEAIGMSHTSGTFGVYQRKLRKLGLIHLQSGNYKVADELFE